MTAASEGRTSKTEKRARQGRVRFRPFIAKKGARYQGRLDLVGFGADAVDEVTPFFASAAEALNELVHRMRYLFEAGDEVEVRGAVYGNVIDAELQLRKIFGVARGPTLA